MSDRWWAVMRPLHREVTRQGRRWRVYAELNPVDFSRPQVRFDWLSEHEVVASLSWGGGGDPAWLVDVSVQLPAWLVELTRMGW